MSSRHPWFKFYPDLWVSGTKYMEPEVKAYYLDLIIYCAQERRPIKDADHAARICGVHKNKWKHIWPQLEPKFRKTGVGTNRGTNRGTNGVGYVHTFLEKILKEQAFREVPKEEEKKRGRSKTPERDLTLSQDSGSVSKLTSSGTRSEKRVPTKRGSRLPEDWRPSAELADWARQQRPDLELDVVVAEFVDYWVAIPGQRGLKLDWDRTFRNRVRTAPVPRNGAHRESIEQKARRVGLEARPGESWEQFRVRVEAVQ